MVVSKLLANRPKCRARRTGRYFLLANNRNGKTERRLYRKLEYQPKTVQPSEKEKCRKPLKNQASGDFYRTSQTGIEPAAFRLGGEPSILLRYWDTSYSVSKRSSSQQALRRRVLYPAELRRHNCHNTPNYTISQGCCEAFMKN